MPYSENNKRKKNMSDNIDGIFDNANVSDFINSHTEDEHGFCLGCTINSLVDDGISLLTMGQSPEVVLDSVLRLLAARLITAMTMDPNGNE